jgi:hypothetical protein
MLASNFCIFLVWHLSALQKLKFPDSNCIQAFWHVLLFCRSRKQLLCMYNHMYTPGRSHVSVKSVCATGPLMLIQCLYEQIKKEGPQWINVYLHSFHPNAIEVQKLFRGSVPASICSSLCTSIFYKSFSYVQLYLYLTIFSALCDLFTYILLGFLTVCVFSDHMRFLYAEGCVWPFRSSSVCVGLFFTKLYLFSSSNVCKSLPEGLCNSAKIFNRAT